MKKFELFFGCLGNGTTVCNKAVEENGDYKIIAHISNGGNITYRGDKSSIPVEALDKIEQVAERDKQKFRNSFERLAPFIQLSYIYEAVPASKFLEFIADKRPLEERLPYMRDYYYSII